MTEKRVEVSGKEVAFRSSAAIPRLYRMRFGRDIFKDLGQLEKTFTAAQKKKGGGSLLDIGDLEVFENIAYIMAKHADSSVPDEIDEWLEQFEIFSIYDILPEILAMWNVNMKTDVEPKKK